MSSEEMRSRRRDKIQRNRFAKQLREPLNGLRGPFHIRIVEDKTLYKREKLTPRNVKMEVDEE